jgi:hypothetical protein
MHDSTGLGRVLRLIDERRAAERRYRRARTKRARQMAFLDLLAVKEELGRYRVATSPVGVR